MPESPISVFYEIDLPMSMHCTLFIFSCVTITDVSLYSIRTPLNIIQLPNKIVNLLSTEIVNITNYTELSFFTKTILGRMHFLHFFFIINKESKIKEDFFFVFLYNLSLSCFFCALENILCMVNYKFPSNFIPSN